MRKLSPSTIDRILIVALALGVYGCIAGAVIVRILQ